MPRPRSPVTQTPTQIAEGRRRWANGQRRPDAPLTPHRTGQRRYRAPHPGRHRRLHGRSAARHAGHAHRDHRGRRARGHVAHDPRIGAHRRHRRASPTPRSRPRSRQRHLAVLDRAPVPHRYHPGARAGVRGSPPPLGRAHRRRRAQRPAHRSGRAMRHQLARPEPPGRRRAHPGDAWSRSMAPATCSAPRAPVSSATGAASRFWAS